jgi:glycosyltransferase involved in cell wall biosynthesis
MNEIATMVDSEIKVSVIMPVYNSEKYLSVAIESVLRQNFKDFELILVDDGSTDNSPKLCDQYGKEDDRIIVIHKRNGGISEARNEALKIVQGEYIAFCDHDDEYMPNLLRDNYALAKQYNADVVKFGYTVYFMSHERVKKMQHYTSSAKVYTRQDIKDSYVELFENHLLSASWDGLYKRTFVEDHHISFDESCRYGGEDTDFVNRCIVSASCFVVSPQIYYCHYLRPDFSTSVKFNKNNYGLLKDFPYRILTYLKALEIDPQAIKADYARMLFKESIRPAVYILASHSSELSYQEKIEEIKDIYTSSYMYKWMRRESFRLLFRCFSGFSIFHVLFSFGLYKLLFLYIAYAKRFKN